MGILDVSACDNASGKSQNVTIANDSGRLSKEDIERMVNDAEKFQDADNKIKARVEAKNELESYCVQIKNILYDQVMRNKFTEDDSRKINLWPIWACSSARWLPPRPRLRTSRVSAIRSRLSTTP